jgi:hypothetical protein
VYEWNGSAWVRRGDDIDGEAANDQSGHSVSLSADGSVIAIGAINNPGNGDYSGHVRVYEWNGNDSEWVRRGIDIDGEAAYDRSGLSVSLSADGSVVAIGAVDNDGSNGNNSGHVRVYEWNGSAWEQRGLDIDGEAAHDNSGRSVSLSADGSVVAIGAPTNDGNDDTWPYSGHVRVYKWNDSAWVLRGAEINGEDPFDQSGVSVSLSADGSVVAIGAPNNNGTGHVRVYSFPIPPPVCFLADAPILTPTGYKAINSIKEGDLVRTAAGRDVTVKRVFAKEYSPSASANPFVIPKCTFGALRALPISPNHEVMTAKGMVKAKDLGLQRMKMTGSFTYYNLELEDWVRDNLVVAGVECESLAPAKRIVMTKPEFVQFVKARYGPSAAARLRSVCFEESDGRISMPAFQ